MTASGQHGPGHAQAGDDERMKVRYNPVIAIVAILLGGICLFLGLWVSMLGEFNPAVIAGLMPTLIGILYLVRPYFWVTPGSVTVGALIGPMSREFMFQRLEADGGRLYAIEDDGTRKKLPVARWLANSTDWRAITS